MKYLLILLLFGCSTSKKLTELEHECYTIYGICIQIQSQRDYLIYKSDSLERELNRMGIE